MHGAPQRASHVLAYRFVRLDDGVGFVVPFDYFTAVITDSSWVREYSGVTPNLHRSPDGTLFIALVASPTGVRKKAIVIDRQSGAIIGAVELSGIGGTFSATLTSSNTVSITFAGTTFPAVPVP